MLLFLAGEYLIRKDVSRWRIVLFVGATTAFGLVLLTLTMLNFDQIPLFLRTIGTADSARPWEFRRLIYGPINTLRNDFFRMPGVVILLIFAFLWLLDFVAAMFKHGIRTTIRSMSTIELYSLCWLAGALAHLSLLSYRPDRRYVMFLVPLTILAMEYVFRTWERVPRSGSITARGALATTLSIRIALCLLAIYAWSYYVCRSIAGIESRWLGRKWRELHSMQLCRCHGMLRDARCSPLGFPQTTNCNGGVAEHLFWSQPDAKRCLVLHTDIHVA